MANQFDILLPNLFNLFTTQGYATLQRHYMAILLRIYTPKIFLYDTGLMQMLWLKHL